MNGFNLPLCSLLLLALTGCKHSDPTPPPPAADPLTLLPKETQTGENTFGCLINGKPYLNWNSLRARGDWTFPSANRIGIYGDLNENGNSVGDYQGITLLLNGQLSPYFNSAPFNIISSTTPYPTFTPGLNQFYASSNGAGTTCYYHGASFRTGGQVVLTKFDGVTRIASGRFAFTLYEPGGCDSLRVTNGRFDVTF